MEDLSGLYRQIVERNKDGIWVIDLQGITTYANPRIAELLGRTTEEMVGLPVVETLDADGKKHFAAHLEDLAAGRVNPTDVESMYLRPDGTAVWFMISEAAIFDDEGRTVGFTHRLTDYTDRRELLAALTHSKSLLSEAQAIAKLGAWEWDLATGRLGYSQETLRLLDVSEKEIGNSINGFLRRVLPEDRPVVEAAITDLLSDRTELAYDARVLRGDHSMVWLRGRGIVVTRAEDGTPIRVSGTVQDVTDLKVTELQLREALATNSLMQVVATAANEATTLDEVFGQCLEPFLMHGDWRRGVALAPGAGTDELLLVRGATLDEGEVAAADPVELDLAARVRASGGMVFEECDPDAPRIGFPVLAEGEVVATIVVTARSRFERHEMLRSLVDHVAVQFGRVVERERGDAHLNAARDAAMEASRLKSEFLATMSHEIRTPLNGVIGLNDLLLRTRLDAHQRRLAEGVQSAGHGLLAIVSDILDFSKIEAGELRLEHVDFDVRAVLGRAAALVAGAAHAKGLELVVSVRPDVPSVVTGDPTRLAQVVANLLSNAVKFTESGEVVVRCVLADPPPSPATPDELALRVEVRDTGIGIDEAVRSRLFEPFRQADASTTRVYGGTGLGLAISAQLVEAMSGAIGVESTPGAGSRFWFTASFHAARAQVPPEGTTALAGVRVLVVDDSASSREAAVELLTGWGMEVSGAAGAEDALGLIETATAAGTPFRLVLVDQRMPEVDGLQLVERIQRGGVPAPAVVLLTSTEMPAEREAAFLVAVPKPLSAQTLRNAVLVAVGAEPAEPPASRPQEDPGNRPGRHGRVLVVEDNEVNRMVALGVLEALGYSADVATDGVEAVVAFRPREYVAVLMDVQMPRMDGYAATRALREREPSGSRVPIIAMTAAAVEGERQRCLDAGMDAFLTKPLDAGLLRETLERWRVPKISDAARGPVLDPARIDMLLEMGDGADGLVRKVIANFVTQLPSSLDDIRGALERDEARALRMAAHRLKGSALNIGAARTGEICLALETLADSGTTEGGGPLLAELETAVGMARGALERAERELSLQS